MLNYWFLCMEEKFSKIKDIVEKELECSAHRIDHVLRVYNNCLKISENEKVDLDVLKAAALLHDIARVKEDNDSSGKIDHAVLGAEMALSILKKLKFPKDKIKHIQDCICTHRYRTDSKPESIEAQILLEADKLDTIGAIGIARGFMWIGKNNAFLYYKPDMEKYISENLTDESINSRIKDKSKHSMQIDFELKGKELEKLFKTKKGKELFSKRISFTEEFLDRLEKEIQSKI